MGLRKWRKKKKRKKKKEKIFNLKVKMIMIFLKVVLAHKRGEHNFRRLDKKEKNEKCWLEKGGSIKVSPSDNLSNGKNNDNEEKIAILLYREDMVYATNDCSHYSCFLEHFVGADGREKEGMGGVGIFGNLNENSKLCWKILKSENEEAWPNPRTSEKLYRIFRISLST